jgi:hypothetical protein
MGRDDRNMTWSGIFWGDDALEQAQQVDALRCAGQPLGLSWLGGSFPGRDWSFLPDLQRPPMHPLSITAVITQTPDNSQSMQGVDSLISNELAMSMAIIMKNVNKKFGWIRIRRGVGGAAGSRWERVSTNKKEQAMSVISLTVAELQHL